MLQDSRTYQILSLSLFWLLGVGTRDWTVSPKMAIVTIFTCVMAQGLAMAIRDRFASMRNVEPSNSTSTEAPASNSFLQEKASPQTHGFFDALPSALITGLGLTLLLRTNHYSIMMLAATAAILSKFLLRVRDKHIFNPANFGIIVALMFTSEAWVSPGQWGEERWYALVFLSAGGLVLRQVGRWDTSVMFLAVYAALEALRNLWLGWSWDVWEHRLTSGSLLLFALFMLTDPRTIPNARAGRLTWAIVIAVLTYILRNYFFISTAVFWSLFILSPVSIGLDILFPASPFSWFTRLSRQDLSDLSSKPVVNQSVEAIPPA